MSPDPSAELPVKLQSSTTTVLALVMAIAPPELLALPSRRVKYFRVSMDWSDTKKIPSLCPASISSGSSPLAPETVRLFPVDTTILSSICIAPRQVTAKDLCPVQFSASRRLCTSSDVDTFSGGATDEHAAD